MILDTINNEDLKIYDYDDKKLQKIVNDLFNMFNKTTKTEYEKLLKEFVNKTKEHYKSEDIVMSTINPIMVFKLISEILEDTKNLSKMGSIKIQERLTIVYKNIQLRNEILKYKIENQKLKDELNKKDNFDIKVSSNDFKNLIILDNEIKEFTKDLVVVDDNIKTKNFDKKDYRKIDNKSYKKTLEL
jgi:alpha-glucosidase (family GH31 glycosyl hydrolase)